MSRKTFFLNRQFLAGLGLALLLFAFAPLSLCGQAGLGTILGRVTDKSGAVVPSAQVTLRNEATAVSFKTQTNSVGDYLFTNLIPGSYQIRVTAERVQILPDHSRGVKCRPNGSRKRDAERWQCDHIGPGEGQATRCSNGYVVGGQRC